MQQLGRKLTTGEGLTLAERGFVGNTTLRNVEMSRGKRSGAVKALRDCMVKLGRSYPARRSH